MSAYVIYRLSDRMVVGYSHPRDTAERESAALAAEVQNITQSELGGVPGDYGIITVGSIPTHQVAEVAADLSVTWAEPAAVTQRRDLRGRTKAKLRALGLADDEVELLVGRD